MRLASLPVLAVALATSAAGQPAILDPGGHDGHRRCATPEPTAAEVVASVRAVRSVGAGAALRLAAEPVTVPVAFHVLTSEGRGDVTDAQIRAQIDTLNSAFRPVGLRFALALVQRVENAAWHDGLAIGSPEERAMKRALALDPSRVLNVYTADLALDYLGWAALPGRDGEGDPDQGVVLLTGVLPGGSEAPYNLGHTGTHEVGHWAGLLHTFAGGCSEPNDGVADTPQERSPATGCPTARDSCPLDPGPDPVTNFMDYSDDACMTAFTPGQAERASALVAAFRPTLTAGGYVLVAAPAAVPGALVGVESAVEVRVTNTTGAPVTVTGVVGGDGARVAARGLPVVIGPGEAAPVEVAVTPSARGPFSAAVTFETDGGPRPNPVTLSGSATLPPTATLRTDRLDLRLIEGAADTAAVTLANTGEGPLSFAVDDRALPAYVASVAPARGVVPPGGSVEIAVAVEAAAVGVGAYAEPVVIRTNDPARGAVAVTVALDLLERPAALRVDPLFPNPAAGLVTVPLALPDEAVVRAEVYDVRGRRVAVLAEGQRLPAGYPALRWDARGAASGVYLVRVSTGRETALGRVTIAR